MSLRSSTTRSKEPKSSNTTAKPSAARLDVVRTPGPVLTRAVEVFGDLSHAQRWLAKPNARLGNLTPSEVLSSTAGRQQVEEMLGQIDEGMFA